MKYKALLLSSANAGLYLAACALIGTGLMLELRMDEEDRASRLLGMGRDDWGEIHLAVGFGFVALTLLHLLLNGSWIKAAFNKSKMAMLVFVTGLVLVAGPSLWP